MRVSHVINGLGIGGAERALLRLVQDTSGEVSHSIVCLTDIDSLRAQFEQVPGTRVHLLGARRGLRGASAVWSCARWLSDSRPQVVHAWLKQSCAIAGLATAMMPSLRRVPLVWGVRDTVERSGASASERVALAVGRVLSQRCDLLLSNSALALEQLASAGYRPRRAQVLHNGVEFPAWEAVQAERVGRRAALGIPPDAPVVLHVGTTHPSKDPACLLRCVEEVHRHVPGVVVVRAGRPPLPGEATADALALMTSPLIRQLGEVRDVPSLMCVADVLVLTSRREGCPNVVLEAMASGVPVVGTDVGDVRTIVGDAGVVCAVGDWAGLAAGVVRILSMPPAARSELSRRARSRIRAAHLRTDVAARISALYRELTRPQAAC
jgi:glycosyltransferase involved in cell wall biosynthesis